MAMTHLYIIRPDYYTAGIKSVLKVVLETFSKICYVTLDKTGIRLREFCAENVIDTKKITIVDLITLQFREPPKEIGITYASMNDITSVQKTIITTLEQEHCDVMIIDSLSSMRIYCSEEELVKLVHSLLVYAQERHVITCLIIQSKDEHAPWAHSLSTVIEEFKEIILPAPY